MITGAVSSEGQITIPEKIRKFLKVKSSDKIVFTPMDEGKVIITKKKGSPTKLFGMLKHRSPGRPVSLAEMKAVIYEKRQERGLK